MDVLDNVLLTQEVWDAWVAVTAQVAPFLLAVGVRPEDIPYEQAEVTASGQLRLFIEVERVGFTCELFVPAEHWAWKHS